MSKVWFVTGSSRGFGRQFVESALARGDRVAATARSVESLEDLVGTYGDAVLPITLDVTEKAAVFEAVDVAVMHFGRLDVVVNNAGHGLFGTVEELSEEDFRAQMEVNVFGALWVTQAVLPYMRELGSGHIVQISSFNGIASFLMMGGYSASKFALEGFSDALAQEVAGFGIQVTVVEPGPYSTDWGGPSAVHSKPMAAYGGVRHAFFHALGKVPLGDPAAVGPALLKVVDAENPPSRVMFGSYPLNEVRAVYQQRLETWNEWGDLAIAAEGAEA